MTAKKTPLLGLAIASLLAAAVTGVAGCQSEAPVIGRA